jgi:hypothetical protein
MKINLIILLISLPYFGKTQPYSDYNFKKIDKWASADIPRDKAYNVKSLAEYLSIKAENDVEKTRAFYVWIANHIDYADSLLNYDWLSMKEHVISQSADMVYQRKSAICLGYAELFKTMCEYVNIPAESIFGLCKDQDDLIANMGHAWNAVLLNGKWELVDPTWGSVELDSKNKKIKNTFREKYFLTPARVFLEDHFPVDPIWQLLDFPLNKQEFADGVIKNRDKGSVYPTGINFADSIRIYLKNRTVSGKQDIAVLNRALLADKESEFAYIDLGSYHLKEAVRLLYNISNSIPDIELERILELNLEIKNLNPVVRDHLVIAKKYKDKLVRNELTENAINLFEAAYNHLSFVYYGTLAEIKSDALMNKVHNIIHTPKKWNEIEAELLMIDAVIDTAASSLDSEKEQSAIIISVSKKILNHIHVYYLEKRLTKYLPGWEDCENLEISDLLLKKMDSLLIQSSGVESRHQESDLYHSMFSQRKEADKSRLQSFIIDYINFSGYFVSKKDKCQLASQFGDMDDIEDEKIIAVVESQYDRIIQHLSGFEQQFEFFVDTNITLNILRLKYAFAYETANAIREVAVDRYNQYYNNLKKADRDRILTGLELAEQYFLVCKSYTDAIKDLQGNSVLEEMNKMMAEDDASDDEESGEDEYSMEGTIESLRELIKEVKQLKIKN